jgi:hypothetical protein
MRGLRPEFPSRPAPKREILPVEKGAGSDAMAICIVCEEVCEMTTDPERAQVLIVIVSEDFVIDM